MPERQRHELTWERVANPSGQRHGNRGLDLLNEHLNNTFKGMFIDQYIFLYVALHKNTIITPDKS